MLRTSKLRLQRPEQRDIRRREKERADGLSLSSCYETMSLQVDLIGGDRFLIPFKANARHIGDVKQSVTDFIGPL
jgi:hypothetical protein